MMNIVLQILATAILAQTVAFGHPAEAQSPSESEVNCPDRATILPDCTMSPAE